MPVVLVRAFARGADGERPVHFADPAPRAAAVTTYCGRELAADAVETLSRLTGVPCNACLLLVAAGRPGQVADGPVGQVETPSRPTPARQPHPGDPAVGLRDERSVHRVPRRPITSVLDGRVVVLAECGALALPVDEAPPRSWQRCPTCAAD